MKRFAKPLGISVLVIMILALNVCARADNSQPSTNCTNYKLANPQNTLDNFAYNATYHESTTAPYGPNIENHSQGIAQWNNYTLVSENVTPAIDFYDLSTKKYVKSFQFGDTNLNGALLKHYGGCQQIGDYLVVGIESTSSQPNESYVCFYDISNNTEVRNLRITRPSSKAGAVGITNYYSDGQERYCMAVYDNGPLDIYLADKPLYDAQCSFGSPVYHFNMDDIAGYREYSELCMLTGADNNLYLMGFRSVQRGLTYVDYIDLYSLNLTGSTATCNLIESKHVKSTVNVGGVLGIHFRYAGGLQIKSPTSATVWTCDRNPDVIFRFNSFDSNITQ